jgi:hypothetical protein
LPGIAGVNSIALLFSFLLFSFLLFLFFFILVLVVQLFNAEQNGADNCQQPACLVFLTIKFHPANKYSLI